MYLKIPRVIPESHDVWTAISNNNISRLQYLFAQKEILSTDISQRGVFTLGTVQIPAAYNLSPLTMAAGGVKIL